MKGKEKYENTDPMRVYYGHSVKKYNTPEEMMEEEFIRKTYNGVTTRMLELCNPRDIKNPFKNMDVYFDKIRNWADVIVVSEYQNHVGKGVYDEIELALELKKQVWVLRKWKGTYRFERIERIELDQGDNDWKVYYGQIFSYNDLNPDLIEDPTIEEKPKKTKTEIKEDASPIDENTFGVCKNCGARLHNIYIGNLEHTIDEKNHTVEMKCSGCNTWYTFPLCPYYYDGMCSHVLGCVMQFYGLCPAKTYETNDRYLKVTEEDRKAHFYKTKEAFIKMEGVRK